LWKIAAIQRRAVTLRREFAIILIMVSGTDILVTDSSGVSALIRKPTTERALCHVPQCAVVPHALFANPECDILTLCW